MENVLVLGASPHPSRYSNRAVQRLLLHGHQVFPLGNRPGTVAGKPILLQWPVNERIDTVSLYLNPSLQPQYYQAILSARPRRVIFNPGTENPDLETILHKAAIHTTAACTLVMLSTGQF